MGGPDRSGRRPGRVRNGLAGIAAGLALLSGMVVLAGLAGCGGSEARHPEAGISGPQFERINRAWRERRLARLTEPYGWLSLTGLVMLAPGETTLGSSPDNDVELAGGPDFWGVVVLDEKTGEVRFEPAETARGLTIDGAPVDDGPTGARTLLATGPGEPTTIEADRIRVHLVAPGGRPALRIRDPESPARTEFVGLEYYPLDRNWRIDAEFVAHPEGKTIQIANVMGQLIDEPNPGAARFQIDGKTVSLEAVLEDDKLFFIFADRTSGRETYGLGRFLYADLPRGGRVILDFNQAHNPPCAFNAFTTCPLPPPANRIDAWVRAGEMQYAGTTGLESPRALSQRSAGR
ncbi:MAG: DUF1684 domain-containing protein [Wenzhouxiangellaceae bacterium]|nr:DUF1684 domain-containing protein [Wenzhouxiangellaceae bacterium]